MNIIPQIYNNTASCETDISTVSIIPHLSTSQQSNDSFQITDEPMDMSTTLDDSHSVKDGRQC